VAPPPVELAYSGFRVHHPLNRPDHYDEFAVFQGASYFRAIGRGQSYGLSARGLALSTAEPTGEEFPIFRAFWIERPAAGAGAVVAHALLDSPSTAGAFRFVIRPGEQTEMEVDATLYPRVDLTHPGIAPLTSMFFFGSADRVGVDDFRPAVHDSGGLAIWNGRGERLWRPLGNPAKLQISQFLDDGPRGFGLLQRQRRFETFEDLEANYERRPSLWVEPVGNWGPGAVHLIEIPSNEEIHDNIVAYWRPAKPIPAGAEHRFGYRLFWCWQPAPEPDIAIVASTRIGASHTPRSRLFVVDFAGGRLKQRGADRLAKAVVEASQGHVLHPVVQPNPSTGGQRVSFLLDPADAKVAELRCFLTLDGERISEVWTWRWTS
jgi:glucans biosynthesis protein